VRGLIDSKKPAAAAPGSLEAVIPEFYKALRVWRDGQGDVIQIGFDAADPQLAAAVPNRLISVYLEERQDSIRRRLDTAEEWIHQRIAEQQTRAKAARDAADRYQRLTGVVANEDAQSEDLKSISQLTDRQGKIEDARGEIKATISTLDTTGDISLALQNAAVPDSIAQMLRDLRGEQADLGRLLETYGENAQAVIDLRAKVDKSRTDLGSAVARYLQTLRTRLASLDREDDAVQSALAIAQEKRSRTALAQTELARLEHNADKEQTALDRLEEQRRGLAGQAMLPGAEVEVLSPAAVPLVPQGHGRLFYLIGALLGSISIAVTAAFAVEMWDRTVRSFDQLGGMTRILHAGFIPHQRRRDRRPPSILFGRSQGGMFAEAIRSLIISLKQSNSGKLPASIVVTSAHSGEGKSFVARSLAVELAACGNQVLLVDADLRRGNLAAYFAAERKPGLNEFLSGDAAIADIMYHHGPSGVDLIPSGDNALYRRPSLANLSQIIEAARAKGQIVVFDSAPVLASTDTVDLASMAERTLVVAKWAKTSCRAAEFTIKRLRSSSNADISVAINNVIPKAHALYSFSDSELFQKSLMKYHVGSV
jgi:uncharacterized protein involved in exopolysaccharide biosynthesis/Mrp family chromosome partitioning ATPase